MPVKIGELTGGPLGFAAEPTLTADGKTMYYTHYIADSLDGGIYRTVWQDTSWSAPVFLNANVNWNLAEGPSISPGGDRIYFRNYGGFGGWDLYYCDWDSTKADWGAAVNLGPNINSSDDEWGCFTPDDLHLYSNTYGGLPRVSLWEDSLGAWGPYQFVDITRFLGSYGRPAVPASQRKVYYDSFTSTEDNLDIYVNYYDTTTSRWGYPMILNVNRLFDSLVPPSTYYSRRLESHPWISPDGHTMYFQSSHDSSMDIWMTRMVIDENGNPVTGIRNDLNESPGKASILESYPNPFNPATTIRYHVPRRQFVELSVFNLLGELVKTLVSTYQDQGEHYATWNGLDNSGSRVASGIYLCRLQLLDHSTVTKLVVVR